MQEPVVTLKSNVDFFTELLSIKDSIPVITSNKKESFFNLSAGFDIETSSFYDNNAKVAIMYEWTFGIGYIRDGEFCTCITYGRTWKQFQTLLYAVSQALELNENRRLVVYVHNLPYEWQFMRKHFSWTKVFYIDERKPVYAINEMNVEFRCSLKLSGKSLANTAKDLLKYKALKAVGDLDYSLVRHSETPLTQQELFYCENDVRVILSYIQEKIEQEGDITRIPLTKTGYVRRYCKKACFPEMEEHEDAYADIDLDTVGVSRAERVLSRRIYPRKCSPSRSDPYESWFLRLHEFLSCGDDSLQIPDEQRGIYR